MIEYKLIDGERYYRMNPNDRWKKDNVTKKEGEERLTGKLSTQTVTKSPPRKNYSRVRRKKKKVWFWIVLVLGIVVGFIYNRYDTSVDESFIETYMKGD